MDFVVELVTDKKTNMAADVNTNSVPTCSFEEARTLLTKFVEAKGGKVKGWHQHDGEPRVGSALVQMSEQVSEALHDTNVSLLYNTHAQPFIARIAGELFNISPAKGITIYPRTPQGAECTI